MQGSIIPTTVNSARGLTLATGVVSVAAANSPVSGQSLVATSPTTATWQTVSAGGGVGNFTGLGITGSPTTYLTGAIALIGSGLVQLSYSGNNIVISLPSGEPITTQIIGLAAGQQTQQVNYNYAYSNIPAIVGIVNNTGANISGSVSQIPLTFVNQTRSGALAVLASPTPAADYTLNYNVIVSGATASSSAGGAVVQVKIIQESGFQSTTSLIPLDDTVPLISEGTELLSLGITPTSINHRIKAEISISQYSVSALESMVIALFRDSSCILAGIHTITSNGHRAIVSLETIDSPSGVSSVTYSVRYGSVSGGTIGINGHSAARFFGGTSKAALTLSELTP